MTKQNKKPFNYDIVRKIAQREGPGVEADMLERVENFLQAHRKPNKKIGEKREQRTINPDFVAPEPLTVTRFEQKNHEDRWSRTVYGNGLAKTTVQDPRDPTDAVLDPITNFPLGLGQVTGEEEREVHPPKLYQLQVEDVEADESDNDPG